MNIDDAGMWKPAPGAYAYAAQVCSVDLADMLLVAVHPWDIDGAGRAGARTCWLNRRSEPFPTYFSPPELTVATLPELARLTGGTNAQGELSRG